MMPSEIFATNISQQQGLHELLAFLAFLSVISWGFVIVTAVMRGLARFIYRNPKTDNSWGG